MIQFLYYTLVSWLSLWLFNTPNGGFDKKQIEHGSLSWVEKSTMVTTP